MYLGMDSKELMMIKMEKQNHVDMDMDILSDPFSSLPLDTVTTSAFGSTHADDQKTSLGFMELLGFQDFIATNYSSPSIFDNIMMHHHLAPSSLSMDMEIPTSSADHHKEEVDEVGEDSSVVLNVQPSSPNSSSLSSPHDAAKPLKQCMISKKTIGGDEAQTKTKTKTKKKKEREARFAFMTRTEIDHLDDGYRWRKYGQKAVKNSPFPRSYYRCTSASCNVKKRVERCMGDPAFVVTTYEGQHIHPIPSAAPTRIPYFNYSLNPTTYAPAMDHGGLLQDVLAYHRQGTPADH
ncbi:hypothetical protein LXL04_018952 [Taraxacum kok-saghyz]